MATEYRVWNGQRFKGRWTDRDIAARYMAIQGYPADWRLVQFEDGNEVGDVADEVIAAQQEILAAEQAEFTRKAELAPAVHHLKGLSSSSGSG